MLRAILQVWLLSLSTVLAAQIWVEDFDNLSNGTTQVSGKWSSSAKDCDDGNILVFGDSFWGVLDGKFVVNDMEGFPCCSGLGSGGGGRQNFWLSEKISIHAYCEVVISVEVSAEGNLECDSPNEPVFICTGLNPPDNSHDQFVAEYSLDGGDFQRFGYSCGDINLGIHTTSPLEGDSIQIRFWAANSSNSETYFIDNIKVTGILREQTTFSLPHSICESAQPYPLPALSNEGTAGNWNYGTAFNPIGFGGSFATLEFIPFSGECSLPFVDSIQVNESSFSTFDTIICEEDFIEINGQIYDANNPSGSQLLEKSNYLGCDSILHIQLSFHPKATYYFSDTICLNEEIIVNGVSYNQNNLIGEEILSNASFYGCDSFIFVNLIRRDSSIHFLSPSLCENDSIVLNGKTYNISNPTGIEVFPDQSQYGCDSFLVINLDFEETTEEYLQHTICPQDTLIINGIVYDRHNTSGVQVLSGANVYGCDSILHINIDVLQPVVIDYKKKLCPTESIEINGTKYDQSNPFGTETFGNGSTNNCDSIINISLNFYSSAESWIAETFCSDTKLVFDQTVFDINHSSGTVILAGAAFNGCDSIIHVEMDFFPASVSYFQDTLWEDERLQINGSVFYEDLPFGEVTLPNSSSNGCDSTIFVDLFFKQKKYYAPNAFSPNGDGFNDSFTIFGGKVLRNIRSLQIFNRWGGIVFREKNLTPNDLNQGWNGKYTEQDAQSGVYFFYAEIEFSDGKTDLISGEFVLTR
jgi:gliding motility-associated-like protein